MKIAQVRIFSSAHHMLKFLAADLVSNNTDPTKFYTDLYGGCTCAHAFVAMRFERPDEASMYPMTRTAAVDTLLHSTNILLRTWFIQHSDACGE